MEEMMNVGDNVIEFLQHKKGNTKYIFKLIYSIFHFRMYIPASVYIYFRPHLFHLPIWKGVGEIQLLPGNTHKSILKWRKISVCQFDKYTILFYFFIIFFAKSFDCDRFYRN